MRNRQNQSYCIQAETELSFSEYISAHTQLAHNGAPVALQDTCFSYASFLGWQHKIPFSRSTITSMKTEASPASHLISPQNITWEHKTWVPLLGLQISQSWQHQCLILSPFPSLLQHIRKSLDEKHLNKVFMFPFPSWILLLSPALYSYDKTQLLAVFSLNS